MIWLHRYAKLVSAASLLLIAAGGLVTSTGSGLAVPDWPTTYGYFMFSFPLSKMVGGILYEHGHRLIASTVGLLTIGLAAWLWVRETRPWVKYLGIAALAAVILQGLLGGLTVLFFLPAPISIGHAGLAQIFLCLVVSLALFTSPGWLRADTLVKGSRGSKGSSGSEGAARSEPPELLEPPEPFEPPELFEPGLPAVSDDRTLSVLALALPAAVYAQILIGATMRHTGAGLAIPDFPLAFGQLLPPAWTAAIAVHFAHRVGAVVTLLIVLATAGHVWAHRRQHAELARPAASLVLLVVLQIFLGAWTVLGEKAVPVNTAHVAVGALVLATSVVLGLRVHRDRFSDAPAVTVARARRTNALVSWI